MSHLKGACDYLASCVSSNNPLESLDISDIDQLINYLEQLRTKKVRRHREMGYVNEYHNPYEYGSKQNCYGQLYKKPYRGRYDNDPHLLDAMGLPHDRDHFSNSMRNVNLETSLLQKEITRTPGQHDISEMQNDRFTYLPFNPQSNVVWSDDMPRGGYATRTDRIEL